MSGHGKSVGMDVVNQKHALLVQSISENKQFHQLVRQLSKTNNKSSISKAFVDATRYILDNNTHVCQRRCFLPLQLERLETEFHFCHYIDKHICVAIARELQLDEYEIRQWFVRRRMKNKRQA
ncbi:hypothetical protein I4U23_031421 [Adineta vaga]|nr:hypothetical protein I4U23_031421 [Adineta vaga]